MLTQESRSDSTYTVVWLVLAGSSMIAPLSIVFAISFVITFSPAAENVLAVLIVAVSLFGFTFTLILADKAFRRSRIAKRTLLHGRARIFKGNCDSEDPTDDERERLVEKRVLEPSNGLDNFRITCSRRRHICKEQYPPSKVDCGRIDYCCTASTTRSKIQRSARDFE